MKLARVRFQEGQEDCRNSLECELTRVAYALDPVPVPQTGGYLVRCPCHDDTTASLSLRAGRQAILVRCFAGCSRDEVLAQLRNRSLSSTQGSSPSRASDRSSKDVESIVAAIRRDLMPGLTIPVVEYLRSRGIDDHQSDAVFFHPNLFHRPTNLSSPAMVALVRNLARDCVALHRTYLADVIPKRMALGPTRGCAIHLDRYQAGKRLVLAEGIETALSVRQQLRKCGRDCVVWATLSAPGLRSLILPSDSADILIAVDNDASGEAAAQDAAQRWIDQGRRVSIARPPPEFNDFNDVLQARHARENARA